LLEVVTSRGLKAQTLTISDGEARSELWNQIKADVLGEALTPALRVEAPSIGAAILAGYAAGLFATITEGVAAAVDLAAAIVPDETSHVVYRQLRGRWEQVRDQVFPTLSAAPSVP
jgi:xylulokinase